MDAQAKRTALRMFLGEVIEAGVGRAMSGRPDVETLALGDLGEKTFYGG